MSRWLFLALAAVCLAWLPMSPAAACPGCDPSGTTFCEDFATMDVVIIARLVNVSPADPADDEIRKAMFQVASVLKGKKSVKLGDRFEALYFGEGRAGQSFLVMGIDPPKIQWSTPHAVSDRAVKYLAQITKLPHDGDKHGDKRLVFFLDYLEDGDADIARDAYDEFAGAPYAQIKALKPHLNHERLVAWIKDREVPATRRRLFLVMLGVCGEQSDVPMLESFLRSTDRKDKAGLDMIVASYLLLRGEAGLPLVEELFLANRKADFADTYATIVALRFHANDFDTVSKPALIKSLHALLDRPDLADLVIPDLARWEDWAAIDKLFDLYKNADPKTSWVRVPVVNYLRSCPLPKAKDLLKECERIDPAAVKRANTFFPTPPAVDGTAG